MTLGIRRYLVSTVFAASFLGATPGLAQSVFISLPDVAGGDFNGQALDLSPNGVWVVGWGEGTASSSEWPWRWSDASGFEELDASQSLDVERATGVSDDGSVVAVQTNSLVHKIWREVGGFVPIPTFDPVFVLLFNSSINNMDASGERILWDIDGFGFDGVSEFFFAQFWLVDSNATLLEGVSLGSSGPANKGFRISSDGNSVVYTIDGGTAHLSVKEAQSGDWVGVTLLNDPNLERVIAVSSDGSYAAGSVGAVPFLWTRDNTLFPVITIGTTANLPTLPGASTCQTYGVSAAGDVVVGTCHIAPATDSAFVWTSTGGTELASTYFQNAGLDLTGWSDIEVVSDVSDDGTTFIGWGDGPGSVGATDDQAFYAQLPTPSVPILSPLGLAVLVALVGATGVGALMRRSPV